MRSKLFTFIPIVLFVSLHALSAPSESLWEEGINALDSNPSTSAEKFEHWIQEAAEDGIHSAEAHYNLAVANWKVGNAEMAVSEMLNSARLRNFPWQIWNDFETIAAMQKDLGIPDNVALRVSSRFSALTQSNEILILTLAGFWFFCAFVLLRGVKKLAPMAPLFLCVGIFFFSVGIVALINVKLAGHLGVLRGNGTVPLVKSPDQPDKIIELPPGTLVVLDEKREGYFKVRAPVPGWTEDYAVRP